MGVFDSGLGGLTVLRALRQRLPREDFLYFADTRYLPYGDRPEAFLKERGVRVAEAMVSQGVKVLVIACNTASAAAAEAIRAHLSIPVVALEPGVKPAAALSAKGVIGVMATTRTLESRRFHRLVDNHAADIQVIAQPCPGLAESIEAYGSESPALDPLLDETVTPLAEAGVDTVVLGCTHYPWVRERIAARLPAGTRVIDTGDAVARQVERVLLSRGLQGGGDGRLTVATSGIPQQVKDTVTRLLGVHLNIDHWEV